MGIATFKKGPIDSDAKKGFLSAGQVAGRVEVLPTCNELVELVIREAEETIAAIAHRFAESH